MSTNQSLHGLSSPGMRARAPQDRPAAADRGWIEGDARTLALALGSGALFGFLLQKGGVAKFDILIGALLLENFVVVKVMVTAIAVGMLAFHLLERRGRLKPQIEETSYGGNVLGGLLFGVGFALLAYCPGTDAAAIGQGNYDALVGVLGLLVGSYLFALASRWIEEHVTRLGARGKLTLPELLHVPRGGLIALMVPALLAVLAALELAGS